MKIDACNVAVFGTAVSLFALASTANAQQVTPLDPITVSQKEIESSRGDRWIEKQSSSATKTETPIVETPQSVTKITRKQLNDQNPQTVKEALNYTAGVLSSPDTNSRYDSLFIRGFGGFGTTTRIVDFLDGLKLPRGQAFALPAIDPYLLNSIDVVKGPSAILYGQTSPGGLVNQNSRAPSAGRFNEAKVEVGSHGRLQGGFSSQGAIDTDGHWQYNLSVIGRRSGTRYENVNEQRVAVSPAIRWQPDADTQLTLRGFYQDDPKGGYLNSIYPLSLTPAAYKAALDRNLNISDPAFDKYSRDQYAIGYSFDHRFNDIVSISSKARYSAIDLDFQSMQMAAPITATGFLPRQAIRTIEDVSGISTDNQAKFDFSTGAIQHKAIAGIDFQRSVSNWEYQFGLAPALNVITPSYGVSTVPMAKFIDNEQTLQQTGIYIQDQLSLGGLRAVFGVRYDWTKQETANRLTGRTSRQSSSAPSYRAGLLYKFDNGLAPYASYSTSFEPTVGVDASGAPFKPTKAQQWEVGLKYEPTFMNALFTIAAFDIRQENVLTPGATPGFNVQQGEIQSRGIEFEARGNITDNLELIAALTLLDTKVTQSTVAANIGKRPQAVPEYYGSGWINYTVDAGWFDGLTLGGGIRFVGSSFADDANTVKADGYVLVDAAMRYDMGKVSSSLAGLEATLNATNLLDKEYYSSCSYNFYCQYGTGRQIVVGLRKTW